MLRFNNREANFFEILLNSLQILRVAETQPSQENSNFMSTVNDKKNDNTTSNTAK